MSYFRVVICAMLALSAGQLVGQSGRKAPAPLPASAGVVVDRVVYDQDTRMVTIDFRNIGHREVTAFGWSVVIQASGTGALLQHNEVIDILPLLSLRGTGAKVSNSEIRTSFAPGETYTIRWIAPPTWGELKPDSVRGQATSVVIYADGSDYGDSTSADRVFERRQQTVAEYADTITQLTQVTRGAGSGERLAALSERANSLVKSKPNSHARITAHMLKLAAVLFQERGWPAVDEFVRVLQKRTEVMSRQSHRKER